ncbi:CDP-glucose 4,6-dehydratase, partial [Rhizobium ruizarguesonis]
MGLTDFWNGRRVFLTGHTGFKGSWLSLWLERLGAEVTAVSLAPETEPS